jgi:hypothetical protein
VAGNVDLRFSYEIVLRTDKHFNIDLENNVEPHNSNADSLVKTLQTLRQVIFNYRGISTLIYTCVLETSEGLAPAYL